MHQRSLIRQHFVELLINNTLAQEKVYDSRLYPILVNEMPAIIIFANNEAVAGHSIGTPRSLQRQLQVTVECYAAVEEMAVVVVDNLTKQVEEIILMQPQQQGLYLDCVLDSTAINLNNDTETPIVVATMTFNVIYNIKI